MKRRRATSTPGLRIAAWLSAWLSVIEDRARERTLFWLSFVLILTTSLGLHAVVGFGFVPGLFNGLTAIDFVIHEFGHMAFTFAPEWLYVAGGTLFQLALPFGAVFMFIRQRDDAAACFAACWLAISLVHTADYVADARATQLDMTMSARFWSITSGEPVRPEETGHDWEYLLSSVGLLQWDHVIAAAIRLFASGIALVAVALNAWMVVTSFRASRIRRGKSH